MSDVSGSTQVLERPDTSSESDTDSDQPWSVIVLDDPVTPFPYVVQVFQKVFGYSRDKAFDLTKQVDELGSADVWQGPRTEAEGYLSQMHLHGLQAKLEKRS